MTRNVPISLANPNTSVDNPNIWLELNRQAGGSPDFAPVEIKTLYVIGLISDICQSVEWLLKAPDAWPNKYLPAFALFASGVDLLGRCLIGNTTAGLHGNLGIGFHYLARPTPQPPPKDISHIDREAVIVVGTNRRQYTVADLVALRHYTAHGQATTSDKLPEIHIELLDTFPKLMGNAMETYWKGLQIDNEYCNRMGSAKFEPYSNRAEPLKHTIEYFSIQGNSIGSLFYRLDWQVYK